MRDTRVTGAAVVTMAGHELPDGCVEVENGRIVHVGREPSGEDVRETVDARGMVLIPGLVNTHCHTSQQLARGLADDVDLLTWLHERIWPYESALTEEEAEVSAFLCAMEQIRSGVTTLAEPGGQHVDGMARGLERAGVRALLGRSSMDGGDGLAATMRESTAEVLAIQDDLADRWHGAADGRLRMSYTLRTIFNCSDELIVGSMQRAEALGTITQMHVAEIPEENAFSRRSRGHTTIRHLHELGVLGPRFLAIHAVWVDPDEIGHLADSGTPVSHNAASALRVLGLPPIADMVDRGVTVGLGTDGAPSNNRMSIVDEMYLAWLLQKGLRHDPTVLPARQVLHMATIDGARAVSWDDEIGSIEVGKSADLVLIDPATVNMVPAHDPVAGLVSCMKSENVHSVMCAGRWLLRDRALTICDEAEALAEGRKHAEAVRRRCGLEPA